MRQSVAQQQTNSLLAAPPTRTQAPVNAVLANTAPGQRQGAAGRLLGLQQSHGNRFVRRTVESTRQTRLPAKLQPKLDVSQPGDPSEREAERVANEIMRMPARLFGAAGQPVQLPGGAPVQRCSGGKLCPA